MTSSAGMRLSQASRHNHGQGVKPLSSRIEVEHKMQALESSESQKAGDRDHDG